MHLSLNKGALIGRPIQRSGAIVAIDDGTDRVGRHWQSIAYNVRKLGGGQPPCGAGHEWSVGLISTGTKQKTGWASIG